MAITAQVELEQLWCVKESEDGGSNPYAWVVLLQTDAAEAFTTGATKVGWTTSYQQVLANGFTAGQMVTVPSDLLEGPGPSWPDGTQEPTLIIAAALWDKHSSPTGAVEAGYGAFVDALTLSVADEMHDLAVADAATAQTIEGEIESVVNNAVHRAIKHFLSTWEELFDTLDTPIGSAFQAFKSVSTGPIELDVNPGKDHSYQLIGRLEVGITLPGPPPHLPPHPVPEPPLAGG